MLRRNLLKSLSALPFLSVLKLQGKQEEKPFRTAINEYADGSWNKRTYNQNKQQLTFENSEGNWHKSTYNHNGQQLTYEDSSGFFSKYTYENANLLTYENSKGTQCKYTYKDMPNGTLWQQTVLRH